VRDAKDPDVAVGRILIVRRTEERRHSPPVERLELLAYRIRHDTDSSRQEDPNHGGTSALSDVNSVTLDA
jgi:hypothetical protein